MLHDARQPFADRRSMDLFRLKLGRAEPWHLSGNGHSDVDDLGVLELRPEKPLVPPLKICIETLNRSRWNGNGNFVRLPNIPDVRPPIGILSFDRCLAVVEEFSGSAFKRENPALSFLRRHGTARPSGSWPFAVGTVITDRPPAQIRASGIPALGSYLGFLTADRTLAKGVGHRALEGIRQPVSPSAPRPSVPSGYAGKAVGAIRQLRGSEMQITPDCWSARRGRRSIRRRLERANSRPQKPVRAFAPAVLPLSPAASRDFRLIWKSPRRDLPLMSTKPRNLKVSGFAEPAQLAVPRRKAAELDKAGLLRMQRPRNP